MKAMQLSALSQVGRDSVPLQLVELQAPIPAANQVLLKVRACGKCHYFLSVLRIPDLDPG